MVVFLMFGLVVFWGAGRLVVAERRRGAPGRGGRKNASEGPKRPGKQPENEASGLSPMSVVTSEMISVARATICFGS